MKRDLQELAQQVSAFTSFTNNSNPWSGEEVDKLEFASKDFGKIVEACRFFYKKDPIASSTINKLVEVGINDLIFTKGKLTANEYKIFTSIKDQILQFAEIMAMEFLISGLVVPEISFTRVPKKKLEELGIKNYSTLMLPTSMWIRDPDSIVVKPTVMSSEPSYFYKVPQNVIYFIQNKGKYPDGTEDKALWEELKANYGDFIKAVSNNQKIFPLTDHKDLIFRRKAQPNDPYPIPYLYPALENLKHKRNLRRMDYSIASRVIGAIQLFNLGSDEYPVTQETQEDEFNSVKSQIYYREGNGQDIERVFQLYANHTLKITWVTPDTSALLNEQKYDSINADIIYALGFPRILITGEASKTGTSDPQYAMMSPSKTMDSFRKYILRVVKYIVYRIAEENSLKYVPEVRFKPLRLFDYQTLLKSLADLYSGGNISRQTYASELGYNWNDEIEQRAEEAKTIEELKVNEFAPQPYSNQPNNGMMDGQPKNMMNNGKGNGNGVQVGKTDNTSKPSDGKKTGNNPEGKNN